MADPPLAETSRSPKEEMLAILAAADDTASYDDLLRKLAFHRQVRHALTRTDDRRITTEELRQRLRSWRA